MYKFEHATELLCHVLFNVANQNSFIWFLLPTEKNLKNNFFDWFGVKKSWVFSLLYISSFYRKLRWLQIKLTEKKHNMRTYYEQKKTTRCHFSVVIENVKKEASMSRIINLIESFFYFFPYLILVFLFSLDLSNESFFFLLSFFLIIMIEIWYLLGQGYCLTLCTNLNDAFKCLSFGGWNWFVDANWWRIKEGKVLLADLLPWLH